MTTALSFGALLSCAHESSPAAHSPLKSAGFSEAHGSRRPADEDDDHPMGQPPLVASHDLWLLSWSNNPFAKSDPRQYLLKGVQHSEDCVKRPSQTQEPVPDCEGNGMAAGRGIYACDDPFTSHDYGTTLVMMHVRSGRQTAGLATGVFASRPGDGGLDRAYTADRRYEALVYDFRVNDFGGRAVAIRNRAFLDLDQTKSIDMKPTAWHSFATHAAHDCGAGSAVTPESLSQALLPWADQMEFMSLISSSAGDPERVDFVVPNGKALNTAGIAAAVASDAVARGDADLDALLKKLKAKYPELNESMQHCAETSAENTRACFAQHLYMSLVGNEGSPNYPTYSLPLKITAKVLVDLKSIPPTTGADSSLEKLQAVVCQEFKKNPARIARVQEAYGCMNVVKQNVLKNNLSQWGDDPQ